MTVNSNLNVFCGKVVEDFEPETGIRDPHKIAYRLRLSYETYEEGKRIEDLIEAFGEDPNAGEVEDLIIGAFDFDSSMDSSGIVETLVKLSDKFRKLKNLFIGDITYEEFEISWILQSNVNPVLKAYPNLSHFQVRGGTDLSLGQLSHDKLETLIIETGGMPPEVIKEVCEASLPKLRHLELWLGSENYGFSSSAQDFVEIYSGKRFPKLRYLGLRDSEIADDIAKALQGASVLQHIEELDLSMGTLGDEGAEALLANPAIRKLKYLNLDHHYMSDEMMGKMKQLGIKVSMDDQQEEEEYGRFVEVSE